MCCWNVRTLLDVEGSSRPERRTALVAEELNRYDLDIAALSETRFSGEGHLIEMGCGYSFFWSGKPAGERRDGGVGFAIRTNLVEKLEELPSIVSDRIIQFRLPLACGRHATFVSAYAPTLCSSEESLSLFYESLRNVILSIPTEDKIILSGDFNARVGRDYHTWSSLGRFGIGKMNSSGLRLLQLCSELGLIIGNTLFHQKPKHKVTWTHPRSKQGHLIDYVIVRRRDICDLSSVRVMRGATCWTDHNLVRAKLKLVIRKKLRPNNPPIPKRLNVVKLKDPVISASLRDAFTASALDGSWVEFKQKVYDVSADILGFKTRKQKDWFDENNVEIANLLDIKHVLHKKLLNSNLSDKERLTTQQSLRKHKSVLQKELRTMKNTWWSNMAAEVQLAFDKKDSKTMYDLLKQVFGPRQSSVTPLMSKDGSTLIKGTKGILNRWTEHFRDLFHNPSSIDENVIERLPQSCVIEQMDITPVRDEVVIALKQINTAKSPGIDGIPAEVLQQGGDVVTDSVTALIVNVWNGSPVPQDWIDAILVSLFKGKGLKSNCNDFRGISLLAVVGKVFTRLLLNRLQTHICPVVVPESQCGFRAGRGTADMVFSARQLQEKCTEQHLPLYQVFVDLTKAFDTVNRTALWRILEKLGCPPTFVNMFKQLYSNMQAQVNFNGELSEPIPVDNGVKQGGIAAPTLFSIYFAVAILHAFKNSDIGILVRYRTTGKLFNLTRYKAKTKTFIALVRDLLYADDCDLVAHSEHDMQRTLDLFSSACIAFGLTISLKKTKVMFTPAPGAPYVEPNILIQGTRLDVVDSFVYLGSSLSRDGSLDSEIDLRLGKASTAFGTLQKRVWSDRDLALSTKLCVYDACVVTSLLYSCETWTPYRRHLKTLERFHQTCLRRILNISWKSLTSDTEVLSKAGCPSIEARIVKNHMRWVGHVIRMDDSRLPKQLLYGELVLGKRPQHKPKKRFRDFTKDNLKSLSMFAADWEISAHDRNEWRSLVRKRCMQFEEERIAHAVVKRKARKLQDVEVPAARGSKINLTCTYCGRIMMSKAGLVNHVTAHERRHTQDAYVHVIPPAPPPFACPVCPKLCKSAAGLKTHFKRMHEDVTPPPSVLGQLCCHICNRAFKSKSGLSSHLRAHGREVITTGK